MTPFVGIAGVDTGDDASQVARQFLAAGFSRASGRMGAIGYCVTGEMMGGRPPPSRRYVDPRQFAAALAPDQSFGSNVLHFLPLAEAGDTCVAQIEALLVGTGVHASGNCRVVQINYASERVSPEALRRLKQRLPGLEIIVQVGRRDLTQRSPAELVAHLGPFATVADMLLVDPSQGQGRAFDRDAVQERVDAIVDAYPDIALGFAGGLDPDNVISKLSEFAALARRPFAIDVESGVRDHDDRLSLEKTRRFLAGVARWVSGGGS